MALGPEGRRLMNATMLIPLVGWGVFLLLQARRRGNDSGAAPPAQSPPAQQAAAAPLTQYTRSQLPRDEKGFVIGAGQDYLGRISATVDPTTGVIIADTTPSGQPVFASARDAMRFDAARGNGPTGAPRRARRL